MMEHEDNHTPEEEAELLSKQDRVKKVNEKGEPKFIILSSPNCPPCSSTTETVGISAIQDATDRSNTDNSVKNYSDGDTKVRKFI